MRINQGIKHLLLLAGSLPQKLQIAVNQQRNAHDPIVIVTMDF